MGIAKVKVETEPLPIIVKLAPKFPIIFEKIPSPWRSRFRIKLTRFIKTYTLI